MPALRHSHIAVLPFRTGVGTLDVLALVEQGRARPETLTPHPRRSHQDEVLDVLRQRFGMAGVIIKRPLGGWVRAEAGVVPVYAVESLNCKAELPPGVFWMTFERFLLEIEPCWRSQVETLPQRIRLARR